MKKYILQNDELSYVSETDDNVIKLKRSESSYWSSHAKGELISTLTDSGNGIKIKLGGSNINLDYSEFIELFTIMGLKYEEDPGLKMDVKILKE